LALSFYRHFIFPDQHGYAPPAIDWAAGQSELVAQLSAVTDESSRVFLERELWSYRQAYGSAGREDLVRRLQSVNVQAFPKSTFRGDQLFTSVTGRFPIIAPLVRVAAFVWVARGGMLWFALVGMSMVWFAVRLARGGSTPVREWAIWLLATLFLGPISLIVHTLANRRLGDRPVAKWKQALGASLISISGYAAAWALVIALLIRLSTSGDLHPLIILGLGYFTPPLVGLLFLRGPFLRRQGLGGYGAAVRGGLLTEIITANLGFAVLFPLITLVNEKWLMRLPYPTNPYFWPMITVIVITGLAVLFPVHYWMGRRGFSIWPSAAVGEATADASAVAVPTLRDSWLVLLVTLAVMIGMLGLTISQLG
jgi:hypothetical protein